MLTTRSFFDTSDFADQSLFDPTAYVWQPLGDLKNYMDSYTYPEYGSRHLGTGIPLPAPVVVHHGQVVDSSELTINYGDTTKGGLKVMQQDKILEGASVIMAGAVVLGNRVALGDGVLIEPGTMIKSPAIIGDMCEVRQGAYLRGYCLAGKRCVLGHATEVKHSILLNDAKAGHFAYLGDSILGNDVNLGAGTKLANLKFLPGTITVFYEGERIDTERRKLGAIMADTCQTGCNSVTSPGTIMAKGAILMPNGTARSGYHEEKALLR